MKKLPYTFISIDTRCCGLVTMHQQMSFQCANTMLSLPRQLLPQAVQDGCNFSRGRGVLPYRGDIEVPRRISVATQFNPRKGVIQWKRSLQEEQR